MVSRRDVLHVLAAGAAWPPFVRVGADVQTGMPQEAPGAVRTFAGVSCRWCPSGTFLMGSPADEPYRRSDEAQVTVRLTRGYWMAAHETTQAQWRTVSGAWPAQPPTMPFGLGDEVPVYWVTYADAEAHCAALTARARREGTLPDGWVFRLPTEAQWEYACRAGSMSATAFGALLTNADANIVDVARETTGHPSAGRAVPVGRYRANAWGLYDMHGNIFEWCRDWYHARLPGGDDPDLSPTRGEPNRDGTYSRVRRGGAWNDDHRFCRSALRLRYEPERNSDHIGFRVAVCNA